MTDNGHECPAQQPSKTPISFVQEVCYKRGLVPRYELIQIEGVVHRPLFRFRLTVGDQVEKNRRSARSQSYNCELQSQRCKFLQHHGYPSAF
jgi:hypothetical protein